ncbi:unnamed protein product, partial [Rotaria sp. Silwood1]
KLTLSSEVKKEVEDLLTYFTRLIGQQPSILDLGVLLSKIGDFERAKRFYQRLLVELPLDYIDLGVLYNNLGEIYRQQGYLNETMKYYKKAINELIEPVGFHDEWFAIVHSNIGMVFDARSELFSTIYNGMATIFQRQVLPTSHPSIATTYMNMGLLYYAMQNISLTLGHIHKALEIFLGVLPKNHPQLAVTYISIGVLYDYQDRDFEAIDYYLKAEQIIDQSVLAPDHKLREDIYQHVVEHFGYHHVNALRTALYRFPDDPIIKEAFYGKSLLEIIQMNRSGANEAIPVTNTSVSNDKV